MMKGLTNELKKELFPYGDTLLCGYRGSVAQNTYIPNTDPNSIDDIDVIGVYIAPLKHYLSYRFPKRFQKGFDKFIGEWDAVSYELKHYISLLSKQNPNVLSLLWLKEEHYFPVEDENFAKWGRMLIENRNLFRGKNAYDSFVGYANGQLKRMTRFEHQGYMGEKRKALVKKFKFDVKNASHLIRLLTMGIEFLKTGKLKIYRTEDAEKLQDIKTGKWSLDEVKKEADLLFAEAKVAKDRSPLPDKPDLEAIEKLSRTILSEYICGGTK